ncbi:hypothetical protein D3C72_332530 [compost metagenome]
MIPNTWFSIENLFLALILVVMLWRAIRVVLARGWASLGWLSPLLGVFVAGYALLIWILTAPIWDLPPNRALIILTFAFWSSLLISAALLFPDKSDPDADLDADFWQNKAIVLTIIGTTNLAAILLHYVFLSGEGRIGLGTAIAMAICSLCAFVGARAKTAGPVLIVLIGGLAALGSALLL